VSDDASYAARVAGVLAGLGIAPAVASRITLPLQPEAADLVPVGKDIHGRERLLTADAAARWQTLREAAAGDGVTLQLVSAFRSVEDQRRIFMRKLAAGARLADILAVNAPPGYSEHHTGRAVDVATPGVEALTEAFEQTSAFRWLAGAARRFHLGLSYPRGNPYGIAYEPWHWMLAGRDQFVPRTGDALVVVDVQNDFLPGGALAVPRGDDVVPALNRIAAAFGERGLPVVASRDWHPADHCSFRSRGGPWPPHCIAGTAGAELSPGLSLPAGAVVVSKAAAADRDAYSAFEGTDLDDRLRRAGVARVFVGGLATDYCVLQTVLDARRAGYHVVLLADATRPVEVRPGDGDEAIRQMVLAGAYAFDWTKAA
jgi:nicotinamidase/pyrazinamidase